MSKVFLFCEDQEGGMAVEEFSLEEALRYASRQQVIMVNLGLSTESDEGLLEWLESANVGDKYDFRVGVWVRLKDKQ